MLILAKIFAAIFAVLVIARSFADYKSKKESLTMTCFWIIIWLGILVIAFYPKIIDQLIEVMGGSRTGTGTVFGMAIVFVLFISYRIYVKANRVEKALENLTRKMALFEANANKEGKESKNKKR